MPDSLANLSKAIEHHQRGEIDLAAPIYGEILQQHPNHPDALHLLGLVSLQRGERQAAHDLIKRAVAAQPENPAFHASLGEVFWALNQPERTIECCREALRLNPTSPDILSNLGATLLQVGRIDEAIETLRSAVELQPDLAGPHNNLANALRMKGDLPAALQSYIQAAKLDPTRAEIVSNLGKTFLELGDTANALAHCQHAVGLRPEFAASWVNFGLALHTIGRWDDAVACYQEAIRLEPRLPNAYAGLGNVLEDRDDLNAALPAYEAALRLDPRNAGVLARLANQLGAKLSPELETRIEELLANPGLSSRDRIPLTFGLAQTANARAQFDRAAELAATANGLRRAELSSRGRSYNSENHHNLITSLIETFSADYFARVADMGSDSRRPIFIVGLPRSGTTLVEQILASHPRAFGGGELKFVQHVFEALPAVVGQAVAPLEGVPQLNRESIQKLAKAHLDAMAQTNSIADRFVDKMPENTIYLGLIATLFPHAAIIHCTRDLRDVATSCWLHDFAYLNWTNDFGHIASRFAEYRRVMQHWKNVLPTPIVEFNYETFIKNPEPMIRVLLAHCELEWNDHCLHFHQTRRPIQTASAAQVRQPVYRSSVGRWKNYQEPLADLFAQLESIKP